MLQVSKETLEKRIGKPWSDTELARAMERLPGIGLRGPWVAGGSVRRTLSGEKFDTDIDFFFRSEDQYKEFIEDAIGLGSVLKGSNDKNTSMVFPAVHGNGDVIDLPELKVQAIKFRFYDSIEEVLDSFDFTLSQFGYDGSDVYASDWALWDVARKRIVPHKITFGTSSLRRLLKYGKQGYTACAGALSEILQQVVDKPEIIEANTLYID